MTTITRLCQKRMIGDIKLLKKEPLELIDAIPDEKNILIWYFCIKGPDFSQYKDGYYFGQILHSPEYPLKPPDFKMLTPNGRFLINNKICLSNTGYHSNEWSACWNIKSILTGFVSIMLDDVDHGISHIRRSEEERRMNAQDSVEYNKKNHMDIVNRFPRFFDENGDPRSDEEQNACLKKSKPKPKVVEHKKVEVIEVENEEEIEIKPKRTIRKKTVTPNKTVRKRVQNSSAKSE